MMMFVFISLILKTVQALQYIRVSCGQFQIEGYSSCEIKHNNGVLTYEGPEKKVLIGPFFGLITYKCDQTAGYLMSEIDCEKCNFECSHEEQAINSCETDIAQFWTGVVFGGLLSILIGSFLWNRFYPTSNPNFPLNCKTRSKNSSVFADNQDKMEAKYFTDAKNRTPRKTLASVFAALLFCKITDACDVLIMMAPGNNVTAICQGKNCGGHLNAFTVRHGKEICIEDHFGERVSIQVTEVVWRYRYELAYYTQEYDYTFDYASNCCERDIFGLYVSCARNPFYKKCEEKVIGKLKEGSSEKNVSRNATIHKECMIGGADTVFCAYFSELERKGKLYNVFEPHLDEVLAETMTLSIRSGNRSQNITVHSFDSSYKIDLTKFKLREIDQISLSLVEGRKDIEHSRAAMLHYDQKLYFSDGFEDLKISRSNPDEILKHPGSNVACQPKLQCDCQCSLATESKLRKFLNQTQTFRQASNIIVRRNDSSVIIDSFETAEKEENWELKMRLGSLTLTDYNLMKGNCDVTVLGNFGCSSCNESAYVVFETKNVESEGLMPFQSNCTFDRNTIRCDYEATKLILEGNQDTCYIKLLATKTKFIVNFNYSKFGHQTKTKPQVNCTKTYSGYGEVWVHFLTGAQLSKALIGTIFIFFAFGLFAKIIFIYLNKRDRQLNTAGNEENLVQL